MTVQQSSDSCYDVIAAEYYDPRHVTSRNFDQVTRAAFRETHFFPPPGLVLEVGAGRGRANEFLSIEPSRIVQLDDSEAMLSVTPREPCLLKVLADARDVPLCSQQFSAIVGFLVDPFMGADFVAQAFRLLTPNGRLLLTIPTRQWGVALRRTLGINESTTRFKVFATDNLVVLPSHLFSKHELAGMLRVAGFRDVTIDDHCLSIHDIPVSPDITAAADAIQADRHQLPILHSIFASR